MILANDFSSELIRFQKLLAQMANRVLLDLARAGSLLYRSLLSGHCCQGTVVRSLVQVKCFYWLHLRSLGKVRRTNCKLDCAERLKLGPFSSGEATSPFCF